MKNEKPRSLKPEFKPEYAEQAYKLLMFGCDDIELAWFFGVEVYVIEQWIHTIPAFSDTVQRAKRDFKAYKERRDLRRSNSLRWGVIIN